MSQWFFEGWAPAGPGHCRCPECGKRVSTNALARASHKRSHEKNKGGSQPSEPTDQAPKGPGDKTCVSS